MNHLVRYYDELWHVEITQIKTCRLFHGTPSKLTENNLEPKGHKYGLSKKRNVTPKKIYNTNIMHASVDHKILLTGTNQFSIMSNERGDDFWIKLNLYFKT